jgi:hypothetical protein
MRFSLPITMVHRALRTSFAPLRPRGLRNRHYVNLGGKGKLRRVPHRPALGCMRKGGSRFTAACLRRKATRRGRQAAPAWGKDLELKAGLRGYAASGLSALCGVRTLEVRVSTGIQTKAPRPARGRHCPSTRERPPPIWTSKRAFVKLGFHGSKKCIPNLDITWIFTARNKPILELPCVPHQHVYRFEIR